MFEPYRRDAVSKALFAWGGVVVGITYATVWLNPNVPLFFKLVTGLGLGVLFGVAWFTCPSKPPGKGEH